MRQQCLGMGLIGALFLVTVVALLAVAISRSVEGQSSSHVQELLSARAFLAAESGAQLGVRAVHPASGAGSCTTRTYALASLGLNGCSVAVRCSSETVGSETLYLIEADGRCSDGGELTAERRLQVRTRS